MAKLTKASEIQGVGAGKCLVRLNDYNPAKGHVLMRLNIEGFFFHPGQWYVQPSVAAEFMRSIHSEPNDPDSPKAFVVCDTHQEAVDWDWARSEHKAKEKAQKVLVPENFTVYKVGVKKPEFVAPVTMTAERVDPTDVELELGEEEQPVVPASTSAKKKGRPAKK